MAEDQSEEQSLGLVREITESDAAMSSLAKALLPELIKAFREAGNMGQPPAQDRPLPVTSNAARTGEEIHGNAARVSCVGSNPAPRDQSRERACVGGDDLYSNAAGSGQGSGFAGYSPGYWGLPRTELSQYGYPARVGPRAKPLPTMA